MKSAVTNEILQIIRTHAYKKEMTISEFGRRAGVSKAWLSKLKNTDANLSLETAEKLLSAAGYKLSITKKSSTASNTKNISKEAKIQKHKCNKITNKIFRKMLEIDLDQR